MSDLKPWEVGYIPNAPVATMSRKEIAALGGTQKKKNRDAGIAPKVREKNAKQGRKPTNPERQEKAELATEENISLKKKTFLDLFVKEYIHDFNSSMAYIRAGGSYASAHSGGPEALRTAYVQKQLAELSRYLDEEKIVTRSEIVMGIKREANYFGIDGSAAARTRAWGMLAKIKGMEAPTKVEAEVVHKGGVMVVPMAVTDVEWQDAAAQSQLALKNDVRK